MPTPSPTPIPPTQVPTPTQTPTPNPEAWDNVEATIGTENIGSFDYQGDEDSWLLNVDSSLINKEIPAGITISIGDLVMYLSGDCDSETLVQDINMARQLHPADTVFEYMRSAIITAFPTSTLDELERLTRTQFLKRFAIAENILSKQNSEYERLNLGEIKTADEVAQQKDHHNIDFDRENRAIRKNMGHWNNEEAESRYAEGQRAKNLSRRQAENLDSRRR